MNLTALRAGLLSLVLASCGGGGGGGGSSSSPMPTVTPEGLWIGQTSTVPGSTARGLTGLVFESGEFWFFYDGFSAGEGFVHGTCTITTSSCSTNAATDFNFQGLGIQTTSISSTYVAKTSLNGTITYATGGVTFTTNYSNRYEIAPLLSAIAAVYPSLTIAQDGTFSGSLSSGCHYSGTLTPRSRGNAYTVNLTFGPAPCNNAGATGSGVAFYNDSSKELYLAALTPSNGAVLIAQHHP